MKLGKSIRKNINGLGIDLRYRHGGWFFIIEQSTTQTIMQMLNVEIRGKFSYRMTNKIRQV